MATRRPLMAMTAVHALCNTAKTMLDQLSSLGFTSKSLGWGISARRQKVLRDSVSVRSYVNSPDSRPLLNCRRRLIIEDRLPHRRPKFSFAPWVRRARAEAACAPRRDARPTRRAHGLTYVRAGCEGSGRPVGLALLGAGRGAQ